MEKGAGHSGGGGGGSAGRGGGEPQRFWGKTAGGHGAGEWSPPPPLVCEFHSEKKRERERFHCLITGQMKLPKSAPLLNLKLFIEESAAFRICKAMA